MFRTIGIVAFIAFVLCVWLGTSYIVSHFVHKYW